MPSSMTTSASQYKAVDPEAELSLAHSMFNKLAPKCTIAHHALGFTELAPQAKQMEILHRELTETLLCLNLASKGRHTVIDAMVHEGIVDNVRAYEQFQLNLRLESTQQVELDCLNFLSQKRIRELSKLMPRETEELVLLEKAHHTLRRLENRLELATKQFCAVDSENTTMRNEIHRLLIEREAFNVQWNHMLKKLVKGKEFLMDLIETANLAFSSRDDWCTKLEALKRKGLYQFNKDVVEMKLTEADLNHVARVEEFLRAKGSTRVCEADELAAERRMAEHRHCEDQIKKCDDLIDDIVKYAGTEKVLDVKPKFNSMEIHIYSIFTLLCEVLQEATILKKDLDVIRQKIYDQQDFNEVRVNREETRIKELTAMLQGPARCVVELKERHEQSDAALHKCLKDVGELVKIANITPLMALLGNSKDVTRWNVKRFLTLLEIKIKMLVEVVYGAVKPPPLAPVVPTGKKILRQKSREDVKLVADPKIVRLKPNSIYQLVTYLPCAYCVEDYILSQVYETPAVPADKEYVRSIFQLEKPNTKYKIFTLTVPTKRHPYRKFKTCTDNTKCE